jgi:hypothetical protein
MSYHQFMDDEGKPYGSFEVFHIEANSNDPRLKEALFDGPGWYWWACHPGCLPDGDVEGPFASKEEAIFNALEG